MGSNNDNAYVHQFVLACVALGATLVYILWQKWHKAYVVETTDTNAQRTKGRESNTQSGKSKPSRGDANHHKSTPSVKTPVTSALSTVVPPNTVGEASLSDALLARVLRHVTTVPMLTICATVNKRWARVLSHPLSLITIDLGELKTLKDAELGWALKRFPGCVSLDVSYCKRLTDFGLVCCLKELKNLQTLVVRGCKLVSDVGLFTFVKSCTSLTSVDVSAMDSITDTTICQLAESSGARLTRIVAISCGGIGDLSLQALGRHCPNLQYIDVSGCKSVTDMGLHALSVRCRKLTNLHVAGCRALGDSAIQSLLQYNQGIRTLDLSGCPSLTDATLVDVGRSLPCLRALCVGGVMAGRYVTDSGLIAVAKGCPKLKRALLNGCLGLTDATTQALVTNCPLIEELNLSGCRNITDTTVTLLQGLKRLQALDLRGCLVTQSVVQRVSEELGLTGERKKQSVASALFGVS